MAVVRIRITSTEGKQARQNQEKERIKGKRSHLPLYPEQSDIVQPPVNAFQNAICTQASNTHASVTKIVKKEVLWLE